LRIDDLAYIDDATHATFLASEIRSGDVLLNITGASIGRSAVATDALDGGNVNQHVCEIRLDRRKMDPIYVCAVLNSSIGQRQIDTFQAGGNRQGLNFQQVGSILVPQFTLLDQRAIAAAISNTDKLIVSLERFITKKQDVKRGLMQELLTGKTRLPGFSGDWTPTMLGSLGSTYGGLTGKSGDDFGHGGGRFVTFVEVMRDARLRGTDLAKVAVKPGERQNAVRRGDVLFNGSSETPEEVALASVVELDEPNVFLNSFCFGYRRSSNATVDPWFLAYYFRAAPGRELVASLAQGSTRYNIAKSKLLQADVMLPSFKEQEAIAEVVREADDEIAALERRLHSARAIKQGMMQELLTGRTRLLTGVAA
jgi:type I restriction enzyme S subunit